MVSQIDGVWYCKSTDTKPTGVATNGQPLVEIDTGKIYHFDGDTGEFVEFGGGS
jgi:hypothetical protein